MTPVECTWCASSGEGEIYVTAYGQEWVLTRAELSYAVAACLAKRGLDPLADIIERGIRGVSVDRLNRLLAELVPEDEAAWRAELAREPLYWIQPGEVEEVDG